MSLINYRGKAKIAVFLDFLFHGQTLNNQLMLPPDEVFTPEEAKQRQLKLVYKQRAKDAENASSAMAEAKKLERLSSKVSSFKKTTAARKVRGMVFFNLRAIFNTSVPRNARTYVQIQRHRYYLWEEVALTEEAKGRVAKWARMQLPVKELLADPSRPDEPSPLRFNVFFTVPGRSTLNYIGTTHLFLSALLNPGKLANMRFDVVDEPLMLNNPLDYTDSGQLWFHKPNSNFDEEEATGAEEKMMRDKGRKEMKPAPPSAYAQPRSMHVRNPAYGRQQNMARHAHRGSQSYNKPPPSRSFQPEEKQQDPTPPKVQVRQTKRTEVVKRMIEMDQAADGDDGTFGDAGDEEEEKVNSQVNEYSETDDDSTLGGTTGFTLGQGGQLNFPTRKKRSPKPPSYSRYDQRMIELSEHQSGSDSDTEPGFLRPRKKKRSPKAPKYPREDLGMREIELSGVSSNSAR